MSRKTNLVWMDMEFTGLDFKKDKILQVGMIITDKNLESLDEGIELEIHQDDELLNSMDEWNTEHHNESGLVKKVRNSKYSEVDVDEMLLEAIKKHVDPKKSPLCNNTPFFDRLYMMLYLPKTHDYLHYRTIDVSSFKEIVHRWFPKLQYFEKNEAHTALADLHETIAEMKYYKEKVFKETLQGLI